MIKVLVECDEVPPIEQGAFLLDMERVLRSHFLLDIRVLKQRQADDSLLRLKRTA